MVYATPRMVSDVEYTCRDFLLEHLDAGEDSVGAHVSIDHLAATPLGLKVVIEAKTVDLDRRRVTFEFTVHDPIEQAGRGRHVRFVVDTAKSRERLAGKRAKAGLGGSCSKASTRSSPAPRAASARAWWRRSRTGARACSAPTSRQPTCAAISRASMARVVQVAERHTDGAVAAGVVRRVNGKAAEARAVENGHVAPAWTTRNVQCACRPFRRPSRALMDFQA